MSALCPGYLAYEISIHSTREGGDIVAVYFGFTWLISIHSTREGGDIFWIFVWYNVSPFQSTPPAKAETT